MANRATEKLAAGTNPSDYGEAVTAAVTPAGTYALISMVTSPLTVGNRQDYVVISYPDAATPTAYPTEPDTYRWRVVEDRFPSTLPPDPMDEVQTELGWHWTFFEAPDTVHVTVELEADGVTLATLTLNQTVQARRTDVDAFITANKLDREDAIHELVSDLRPYINSSAVSAGATSAPVRLVAAILWQEMQHRWRDDTDGAERYRKALAAGTSINGPETPGWVGEVEKPMRWTLSIEDKMVREVELETAAMAHNAPIALGRDILARTSLGPGQVRQNVAAMVLFGTTSRSAYGDLTLAQKVEVYNRLRFPKTNVDVVTKLLTSLKNRTRTGGGPATAATPWKTMTRQVMVDLEEPCTAVAQEFNTGATNSYTSSLGGRYGQGTWRTMSNVLPINAAVFFPEPP